MRKRTYTPEQIKATSMMNNLIKAGKVERHDNCIICGEAGYIQAHHPDPGNKPLEVVWCCQKCHIRLDKGLIAPQPGMIIDYGPLKTRDYHRDPDGKRRWQYINGYRVSQETRRRVSDAQKARWTRKREQDSGLTALVY